MKRQHYILCALLLWCNPPERLLSGKSLLQHTSEASAFHRYPVSANTPSAADSIKPSDTTPAPTRDQLTALPEAGGGFFALAADSSALHPSCPAPRSATHNTPHPLAQQSAYAPPHTLPAALPFWDTSDNSMFAPPVPTALINAEDNSVQEPLILGITADTVDSFTSALNTPCIGNTLKLLQATQPFYHSHAGVTLLQAGEDVPGILEALHSITHLNFNTSAGTASFGNAALLESLVSFLATAPTLFSQLQSIWLPTCALRSLGNFVPLYKAQGIALMGVSSLDSPLSHALQTEVSALAEACKQESVLYGIDVSTPSPEAPPSHMPVIQEAAHPFSDYLDTTEMTGELVAPVTKPHRSARTIQRPPTPGVTNFDPDLASAIKNSLQTPPQQEAYTQGNPNDPSYTAALACADVEVLQEYTPDHARRCAPNSDLRASIWGKTTALPGSHVFTTYSSTEDEYEEFLTPEARRKRRRKKGLSSPAQKPDAHSDGNPKPSKRPRIMAQRPGVKIYH